VTVVLQKGVEHALDYMCDPDNSVASGIYQWLHDGWSHSYPADYCRHRVSDPTYSGAKRIVSLWTLAGGGAVKDAKRAVNKRTLT